MTSVRQSPALLAILRDLLREQRITQEKLAQELGVGLATVKRWLTGRGLTIDRLEDLCHVTGTSLSDLLERVSVTAPSRLEQLSLGQERALAADARLTFLFFSILNGWSAQNFEREFDVPTDLMQEYLDRLDRLGLIDRLRSGTVRPLASRRVAWRRGGPLALHFEAEVKKLFLEADFGDPKSIHHSDDAKLSQAAIDQLEALIAEFQNEFHRISELDRRSRARDRRWVGVLVAVRALNPAALQFNGPGIRQGEHST